MPKGAASKKKDTTKGLSPIGTQCGPMGLKSVYGGSRVCGVPHTLLFAHNPFQITFKTSSLDNYKKANIVVAFLDDLWYGVLLQGGTTHERHSETTLQ